jgi:uncharacterized protein (DUF2235 family)
MSLSTRTINTAIAMARKLALYFDGTWNTPGSETNVSRLFKLTASRAAYRGHLLKRKAQKDAQEANNDVNQVKYYHKGVGTTWGSRILGGMFGLGLSKNIRDGLLWLGQNYQADDEIFVFGFSRGAYTARSLVGLIRKCGIPRQSGREFSDRTMLGLVDTAYNIYRDRQWSVDSTPADSFRKTYSWPSVKIKFIGVWDTVGALGLPLHEIWFGSDYYRFHDTGLSAIVENAFHAVALDEHRPDFVATLWDVNKPAAAGQKIEQRWFAGAHADVGGGYKDGTLSQLPLRWMQSRAQECGLQFTHDSPVAPEAYLSTMHDSLREFAGGLYAKLPWIYDHYRPRGMGLAESIDESVLKRRDSPEGKDASGAKYDPPALKSL